MDRSLIMINKPQTIEGKIIKLYEEWKTIERTSRRGDRMAGVQKKEAEFQRKIAMPFNILWKDGEAILCTSGIIDLEEEMQHLRNQLSPSQVGCCDSYDMRQKSRDIRRKQEKESLEASTKRS